LETNLEAGKNQGAYKHPLVPYKCYWLFKWISRRTIDRDSQISWFSRCSDFVPFDCPENSVIVSQ